MKCRTRVEIKNPRSVRMKNSKPATQGVCPKCGTKVFRMGLELPEGPEFHIPRRSRFSGEEKNS